MSGIEQNPFQEFILKIYYPIDYIVWYNILYMLCKSNKMKTKIITLFVGLSVLILTTSISPAPHSRLYEKPIQVESWMTQPFNTDLDEELFVEDWMTQPFDSI